MVSGKGFLNRKVAPFYGYFWASVSTLLLSLFGFVSKFFKRYNNYAQPNNSVCSNYSSIKDGNFNGFEGCSSNPRHGHQLEPEPEQVDCSGTVNNTRNVDFEEEEEEKPKFVFKFKFQTYEDFCRSYSQNCNSFDSAAISASAASKYEFMSGKNSSHFLEEPEVTNFTVKKLHFEPNKGLSGNKAIQDSGFLSEEVMEQKFQGEFVRAEIPDNPTISKEEFPENLEPVPSTEEPHSVKEEREKSCKILPQEEHSGAYKFLTEYDFIGLDSESDSTSSTLESSSISQFLGSSTDGFLSDKDFECTVEFNSLRENGVESLDFEEMHLENLDFGYEPDDFNVEDSDIIEEIRRLEESQLQNTDTQKSETMAWKSSKPEEFDNKGKSPIDCLERSTKPNSLNSPVFDSEDSNALETLWEHQELIEQLKMELKKVRATGLSTILEESESPKMMEDLKPWKIDEKFQHGNRTKELSKFYKSYRERMRKFDILNYQKMYAIGFLQSKDPLQSFSSRKASASAISSLLSNLYRRKRSETDPMNNFIKELYCELEVVYVGQLCLSWEFLHWQYEKAVELWENDPYGLKRYNEVAGEFQQFQVLMQRFIENEPFQGPRVESYIKNRCVMRNLLQVPVIREDNVKDKRRLRRRGEDDDAITSDKLVEILEESIRIIWHFIRADKDANNTLKSLRETHGKLQDPATDADLLAEIIADLQKKEKRVRDVLKIGSCILKKFQKHQEDGTDHFLYFFSQVDMKLVCRILNMSRITTEQLAWCRSKLNKISFVNHKIHVEPSFLLFPCS
ncbi:Ribosomal protein L34Ae [Quillaja saponaria]|uniref:Ribosomal protein L34Ae n=1 Tax=Quillaja saponaria TaxID=32244 RepID=A0AAD7PXH3_QUISA|nr:Ribosomal protein L34Ae [Quillaja saponaria]